MNQWICQLNHIAAKWPTRKQETLTNILLRPELIAENPLLPLMGPSGQGKSSLLYILAALKYPSEGRVSWTFPDGKSCSWDKNGPSSEQATWLRRERFGFAFQDNTLSSHLTVVENIAYPLVLRGQSWSNAVLAAKTQLNDVLLPNEDINVAGYPHQLSGGQQQRVALAQSMIHQPWVLFADEPTGQLDYHTRLQVMDVLKTWVNNGHNKRRLIWVTHHHTDDLDMMKIEKLLFVNNRSCQEWNRSELEAWKNAAKKRYASQGEQIA